MTRLHSRTVHHLSAPECKTIAVADLLAPAAAEDVARWCDLRLSYTDLLGAWLRETIATRYGGAEGVERFIARMSEKAGVLMLPPSVFRSELAALPADRFRVGFGRAGRPEAALG